ncbi:hypothetical protein BGW42_005091 [Actinomortierella wolfii]|nr:hypothetical protein BGW42_005091 [Actinomortierella wolfii]
MTPPIQSQVPVLITGAGPVGLFAAILLTQMGIPHRIIERNMHDSLLSKALGVHARTLEIFAMTGIVDDFLATGDKLDTFNVYIGGKRTTVFSPLGTAESRYQFALLLEQVKTGRILHSRYEQLGGQVERGWELVDTKVIEAEIVDEVTGEKKTEEVVETTIRRALVGDNIRKTESKVFGVTEPGAEEEGKQYEYQTVRSKYLIAADGGKRSHKMILYDGLIDTEIDCTKINLVLGEDNRGFGVIPLSDGRVRCIIDAGEMDSSNPDVGVPELEELEQLGQKAFGPLRFDIKTVEWLTYYRVNERIAEQYSYKDRIFLAGDAAHVHSPIGAQGMNLGLQDAFNLTWKIAYVEKGLAIKQILETYGEERKPAAKEVVSLSSGGFGFVFTHSAVGQILRNAVIRIIPYILSCLPPSTSPSRAAMLLIRYHENILNQRHPRQDIPKDEFSVGVRARDGTLKPYKASGSSSDTDAEIWLQTLWDEPGVFHILVFGTKKSLTDKNEEPLDKLLDEHLNKWRQRWQLDPKRPMFEAHIIGTASLSATNGDNGKDESGEDILHRLSSKAKGDGKLYVDQGDVVHERYGISAKNGSGGIVVVRPDAHVGYRVLGASRSAWEDVDAYFRTFLRVSSHDA